MARSTRVRPLKTAAKKRKSKPFRILSIDGGGVRGIVPAMFLVDLEKKLGGPIAHYFDLIAGTSTGGFMALMLTAPGTDGKTPKYSAEEIVERYQRNAKDIFPLDHLTPNLPKNKPCFDAPDEVFLRELGDAEIKDAITEVLVTAYDTDTREFFLFTRGDAQRDESCNVYMRDAARATTAFPMIFPAAGFKSVNGRKTYHMLDGGVGAINPVATALSYSMWATGLVEQLFIVMSIGTGTFKAKLDFSEIRNWGTGHSREGRIVNNGWNKNLALVNNMFDGMASAAHLAMQNTLRLQPYYRFDVGLKAEIGFQDAREETIQKLITLTRAVINRKMDVDYSPEGESTQVLLEELADQLKKQQWSEEVIQKRLLSAAQRNTHLHLDD